MLFFLLLSHTAFCQEGLMYHPSTTAWIKQLPTFPLPKTGVAINLFVSAETNDGNFTLLDRCWVFGIGTQANARVSVVNPTSSALTEVNTPTWTAYQGYAGNGTSSYENMNIASAGLTQYTQNLAFISIYSRTNTTVNIRDYGTTDGTRSVTFNADNSTNSVTYESNCLAANVLIGSVSTSLGLISMIRTSSTAVSIYLAGTSEASGSQASNGVPTTNMFVGANNNNGSAINFSSRQYALYAMGGGVGIASWNTDVTILKNYLGW